MRIRINFAKTEAMRFTGHLDLHHTWERIFRRASLPLAYSHGFHPQPRINLAAALPLGFTSQAEIGDFWLENEVPLLQIRESLIKAVPPGIQIIILVEVSHTLPPLQTQVVATDYITTLLNDYVSLEDRLNNILGSDNILRTWRGKEYNLRGLIEEIHLLEKDDRGRQRYKIRLTALPGATGRPEEVLAVLGVPFEDALVHRVRIYLGAYSPFTSI